jgi:hypothetical protein
LARTLNIIAQALEINRKHAAEFSVRLIDSLVSSDVLEQGLAAPEWPSGLIPPAYSAEVLRGCPLRYVLDPNTSEQCMELALKQPALLAPDRQDLRLPSTRFWVEWVSNPPCVLYPDSRSGIFVECDEHGRSGTITIFLREPSGLLALVPATILFDLDRAASPPIGRTDFLKLRHETLTQVNPLLRHLLFHVDQQILAPTCGTSRRHQESKGAELAETAWIYFPFLLAFCALLSARGAVEQRPSDFERLNTARAKRGRPPLIDFVEVLLRIDGRRAERGDSHGAERGCPRAHLVRGHLVARGGKIFWRRPHVRGDVSRPILAKTVRVTASSPALSLPGF